jgi:polysaccharide biosynthesis protein PslG
MNKRFFELACSLLCNRENPREMMKTTLSVVALCLWSTASMAQVMLRLPDHREGWAFGTCVHQVVQQEGDATTRLDELGAPWVRIDANWNEIEPSEGNFDFTLMDKMIDTSRAHSYLVYATLAYTPEWASPGSVRNGVPVSADKYYNFVHAVVSRYKNQVKHWGLWNEPENKWAWTGSPQEFVELILKPGYQAVHAADPLALVLGPDSGNDEWLDNIFKGGGGNYLDIITVHVYACCDGSDDVNKTLWRLDCTGGWPWDSCRRKVIEANGLGSKPVWLTETGWKTHTLEWEQKQATYYVQLLEAMLARPWWKKTIFYELYDATPCDPSVDNCWGIVRPDYSKKPAFDSFKNFILTHQVRAEAGPDLVGTMGTPVIFNGAASHDPDGTIAQYRWDFDQSDGVTAEAEGLAVDHVFATAGSYVVTLVVTDNHGLEDADTLTVTMNDGAGRCESSKVCSVVADCNDLSPTCTCPGQNICNSLGRCEWVCEPGSDASVIIRDSGMGHDGGAMAGDGGRLDSRSTSGDGLGPGSSEESGCSCNTAAPRAPFLPGLFVGLLVFLVGRRRALQPARKIQRGGTTGPSHLRAGHQ